MEYEPTEYRKLAVKQFAPRTLRETAEGRYWRHFKTPVFIKQIGGVSHIDFSSVYPYPFAVTSSTRVLIYDSKSKQLRRQYTRFKDTAYSGSFRVDGNLLTAGSEDGIVQVFDATSRSLLRQLKAHKRAVHVARFSNDKVHLLSGGDDATVRWWDVTLGNQITRLDGHTDYVRAAMANPTSFDTWATGGYDHICKLWDTRTNECILNMDHGAPIEDVAFFPSGALVATAGAREVRVWDLLGGGRLLQRLANHQKTVTCVRVSPLGGPSASASGRLLTGSLDGHVKVYELDTFKMTHASKYPGPITSLGIAPDCGLLVVGMADGNLSMRTHRKPKAVTGAGARPSKRAPYKPRLTAANYRYFIRGKSERSSQGDYKVMRLRKAKLQPYDRLLRKFQYRETLDAALATKDTSVVASVLEELATRGGLDSTIGGRSAGELAPLLRHIRRHIMDPRHTPLLCAVAGRVLDLYGAMLGQSPQVDREVGLLLEGTRLEVKLQDSLALIQGCLEPILAASMGAISAPLAQPSKALLPQLTAQ